MSIVKTGLNNKLNADNNQPVPGLQRLVFFSDAVIAIAITLLATSIKLPDIPKDSTGHFLGRAIVNLAPEFVFYALSFLIIGSFWMSHHKMFQYIKRYNDAFVFLNLISLMFIAAVPIPTAIMVQYIMYKQSLIFYAAYMALTSLILSLVRFYASFRKRLVDDNMPALYFSVRSLISPAIFLISIPFILLSNYAAISWALIFVFQQTWKKIYISRFAKKLKVDVI